jgi:hypothetical protein
VIRVFEHFVGPIRCPHTKSGRCGADGGSVHSCRGRYRDGGTCGEWAQDCKSGALTCCRDEADDWAFDRAQFVVSEAPAHRRQDALL